MELGDARWLEVFFSSPSALERREVLLVNAMLNMSIPQSFLWQRIDEYKPLSRAVLFDKPKDNERSLTPTYVGFANASR